MRVRVRVGVRVRLRLRLRVRLRVRVRVRPKLARGRELRELLVRPEQLIGPLLAVRLEQRGHALPRLCKLGLGHEPSEGHVLGSRRPCPSTPARCRARARARCLVRVSVRVRVMVRVRVRVRIRVRVRFRVWPLVGTGS